LTLLQREDRLQQIVKLVGPDVLPEGQRLILFIAEIMKDALRRSVVPEKTPVKTKRIKKIKALTAK